MKKQSFLYLFLFCTVVTLSGCSSDSGNSQNGNIILKGTLTNAEQEKLVFLNVGTKGISVIDTIKPKENGDFSLGFDADDIGFYRLKASDNNNITLILQPGDEVSLRADAGNLEATYQMEGSEESSRLKTWITMHRNYYLRMDSLKQAIQYHQNNRDIGSYSNAVNHQNSLNQKMAGRIRAFIKENSSSLAALDAVQKLDPEQDFEYYKMVAEGLEKTIPNSAYYKSFKSRMQEWGKLAVGAVAPEISLETPQGQRVALSSLRGKVVLIDFWASWCKPCRIENPNVVRLYNKYRNQGFEIYGVSLDRNKQAWINAIQQDGLEWIHVSDLQFWNSAPAKIYKVSGIPHTVLLDKRGRIIAKNLRGEQLAKKLDEVLGE